MAEPEMTDLHDLTEPPFGEPTPPLFGARPDESPSLSDGVAHRLAVVTGATGLLGAAIARELAERGAMVCLVGRDIEALDAAAERLGPDARHAVLRCDLALSDDVVAAVDFVERLDLPVDLVVHAAGLQAPARIADGAVESLDEHYLLNVRGPYLLTQRLLPMLRDGAAQCVFVAGPDTTGERAGDAHHAITQAAARALAAELRVEAAQRRIRVLTVVADDASNERGSVDPTEFVGALAANLVEALGTADLDVTELVVRGVPRPVRTEQR